MYELIIDCGTANERYVFDRLSDYKAFMIPFEHEVSGITDELFEKGVCHYGIDTFTLTEILLTYNISVGSVLQDRDTEALKVVRSIWVDEDYGAEVSTNVITGTICEIEFDERQCNIYSVKDVYKGFDLVGEDFKLFKGVGHEDA